MPEQRTAFELFYPHLAQLFDYFTFEADAEIHTTAGVLEGLILLIRSFEDCPYQVPINTLMSLVEAAESSAKEAKPYLDNWAAVEHKFLDTKEEARKIRERNIYGA